MKRIDIISKIINEQQRLIDSLRQSVERYKTASDMDEDSTTDPEDYSQQAEAKDMQLRYEKMMTDAKNSQAFLITEKELNHNEIENGTLIETDKNWLFIGVSLPLFKINDKEVLCFSDDAPIYQKMKGKKIGDQVEIGAHVYAIKSIL